MVLLLHLLLCEFLKVTLQITLAYKISFNFQKRVLSAPLLIKIVILVHNHLLLFWLNFVTWLIEQIFGMIWLLSLEIELSQLIRKTSFNYRLDLRAEVIILLL